LECSLKTGIVTSVQTQGESQELTVQIGENEARALSYPGLVGPCRPGDRLVLNTTAEELNLGSGGWHYVLAVFGQERSLMGRGHIMKLRYTPLQGRVLCVEAEESPYHEIMAQAESLEGLAVAVGSLHSMLAPFAYTLQSIKPGCRLVYLMSDGAALPIAFSRTAAALKELGFIQKTITFGSAFGGDLEAVNVYSALLAAKHVARADGAVILMGPGIAGTGTKWGTTAIEQGIFLNAVLQLKGTALAIPRLSLADQRKRHQGFSHHTLTVLEDVVLGPVHLGLPNCLQKLPEALKQAARLQHKISWQDSQPAFERLDPKIIPLKTMGRGPGEDPLFFHGVLAAALRFGELIS